MAIYVQTNVSSLQGRNALRNIQTSLTTTYQRLSTGMRINSAKDDAAGLQIANRLTSQINGLNQGNRNASDGIALAQTIEGGLDEITAMLQRGRTLAVQSATGTNTADDREAINKELRSIQEEIQRIGTQTTYGGKAILLGFGTGDTLYSEQSQDLVDYDGDPINGGRMTLQVGANSGDTIVFEVADFTWSGLVSNALGTTTGLGQGAGQGGTFADITTADQASQAIEDFDVLIAYVDAQRADLGAIQNRLESSIRNQSNIATNESDARARIRDADFAEESANLAQQSIIQQAAASMLMQANTRPQLALSLLG